MGEYGAVAVYRKLKMKNKDTMEKSRCCGANLVPITSDEGTGYYQCQLCQRDSDPVGEKVEIEECGKCGEILRANGVPMGATKTCLSIDCPERAGGKCTAGEKSYHECGKDMGACGKCHESIAWKPKSPSKDTDARY